MRKVLLVFGTRPEAIKMAPVAQELARRAGEIDSRICVTGQHRDLLDQALGVFPMKVDLDLDLMRPGQTLSDIVVRGLPLLEAMLQREKPDIVLVQGDTSTAYVAALAAFYQGIPVAHAEAGLRTYDLRNPFPEEANRRFIDAISSLFFAPTKRCKDQLLSEGSKRSRIHVTGNTVVDALKGIRMFQADPKVEAEFRERFEAAAGFLPGKRPMVLVTAHRRETFGEGIHDLCRALKDLARKADVDIVYPVHPNPNVRQAVHDALGSTAGVHLLPPLDYGTFLWALARSRLAITDSGGVQEEAPSFGVPILITRKITERQEIVEAGGARLVGTDPATITKSALRILSSDTVHAAMKVKKNPFGDGKAGQRTVKLLIEAPLP